MEPAVYTALAIGFILGFIIGVLVGVLAKGRNDES